VRVFAVARVTNFAPRQNWHKLKAKYSVGGFVLSPVLAQKLHSLKRNLFNNDPTRSI
jgi:hypothetical protein